MTKLTGLQRPYKFIVTCILQQRGGTSHMSTSCHWENTTDGMFTSTFPPISRMAKDIKAIQAITTVYATRF